MADYLEPNMTVEFRRNNVPQASAPSSLEDLHIGRALQIEEDVYLGAYTTEDGLGSTAIPGIMVGANLINDSNIGVSIQLDADASVVDVPTASWTRTSTDVEIDDSLVKVLSDHLTTLDGTLTVATRLLSSPTVDFSEIGLVQGYTVASMIDSDSLTYPDPVTLGTYDVGLGAGVNGDDLYFTGASIPSEQRMVLSSLTDFGVGDTVTQAAATGCIVAVDTPNSVIVIGSIAGTFVVSSTVISSSGGVATPTIDALGTLYLPELKLTLNSVTGFSVGCTVDQASTPASSGTIVRVDGLTIIVGNVTGAFEITSTTPVITSSNSGSADVTAINAVGLLGFKIALLMDGSARISYKALRTDLCGSKTKVTTSTLLDLAGNQESIVPENELIWSAKIATDKGEYCYVQGVDDMNGQIHDYNATASSWNTEFAALKFQSQADCAYQYVILSGNSEVHAYMDLFIAWMRLTERSKLAIAWSAFPVETMDYVVRDADSPATPGAGTVTFTDATKNFTTLGLLAGGSALLTNPADSSDDVVIRIASVSGSVVTLDTAMPAGIDGTWTYEMVNSIYSLDEIANAAKVYAEGFSSRAIRFAWCSSLSMKYDGTTYTGLPAFFWYSYRAADLSAALDLSKTYTNHEVTYLYTASVIPFQKGDTDRLNVVASGGVDIVMQDKDGAPLYSRHALTSDMTSPESREQSATHQYDYAALVIFATYRNDIGKKKIDKKLRAYFLGKFSAIKTLLARKQCLDSLKLISLDVDPDNSTKIILVVDGTAIMPFNNLGVIFYMS